MKNSLLFLAFFLLILSTSCSSNDDDNTVDPDNSSWNLVRVQGGIAGVDDTFATGLITWTFNSETSMVTVVNNNTDDTVFDGFESGEYFYQIFNDGNNDIITIDNIEFGVITETNHQLTLNQIVTDGFLMTFRR